MEQQTAPVISARKKEIVREYIAELDKHISDLKAGKTDIVFEIRTFAEILHIHPVHLSNTVKEVTGRSTCDLFEERLVTLAKEMLLTTTLSVAQIARQMTYDPSNFTKFFKHFTGTTPKKYRDQHTP
jgi:AraC family transcriptional regulator of adaptative response / methylphosphotriester-DNA alkyltransferase methyltransferase